MTLTKVNFLGSTVLIIDIAMRRFRLVHDANPLTSADGGLKILPEEGTARATFISGARNDHMGTDTTTSRTMHLIANERYTGVDCRR